MKNVIVLFFIVVWIFSGWPQVWRNPSFPPHTAPAHAATFQMQTGYYIGTGAANTISGLGFKPDLVIIKSDTALAPVFKTSAMPATTTAYFPATADDATQAITLISDGFAVSSLGVVNTANVRYTWIAFGGSDCSSSGTFCVGTYKGTGANQSITTGFAPDLVWVKQSTAVAANFRTSSMSNNVGLYFIATAANTAGGLFTTLNANGFTVGAAVNSVSGGSYYYVAFKNVSGAMKVGSYIADATDNRNITGVGFVPNFVFVKNASTTVTGVYNTSESYGDYSNLFTATANAVNNIQLLQTDGFQTGTSTSVNASSGNIIHYAAFAGDAAPSSSGSYVMATGSYTGNGAARSITGVGFSPDLVVIKSNTTAGSAVFKTRLMQSSQSAYLSSATANLTTAITSLNGDGFTLGTDATVNSSGVLYYWTAYGNAWRPDTNTGASNFAVFAYYGNGIDNRNVGRLPFQPDLVAAKSATAAAAAAWKSSAQTGDLSGYFAGTAEAANVFQALNADGFQIGTAANVNSVGVLYFGFAFGGSNCTSGGTFCVGTYSGNGGTAQNITSVGFQPANLWIKNTSTGIGVLRTDQGATNSAIPFTALASVSGAVTGLLSNGFSVGTSTTYTNATGTNNYRYVAWRAPTGTPKVSLYKDTDGWSGAIPFSINPNGVSTSTYPYARMKVFTPAGEIYYASSTWNGTTQKFEGTVYLGSWYCPGCADPNVGEYVFTAQMSSDSSFGAVNYAVRAGLPGTIVTRRWNAVSTSTMGNSTDYAATWNTNHWDVSVTDFSLYAASAVANTAVAIPFIPTSSSITITGVTLGGSAVSQGSATSTTNAWWWNSNQHTLYVQAASLSTSQASSSIITFSFTSDTDLWATRVDELYTYNIGDRTFYNGIMVANQYIYTTIFGGDVVWNSTHVNATGEQAELTGHKPGTGDVNLDCMERVAVHVDGTVLPDSSNYYAANIKWAGEWRNWITEATNDHITMVFHNDTSTATGWIQYLNNGISATRTQTYYSGKRYIKNVYQFTNNSASSHSLPFVWMREQWLGTDRQTNDRGQFPQSVADEVTETSTPVSSLSSPWWMNYDTGSLAAQAVIVPEAQTASATAYFLEHPPITTNVSPWAEWPVVVTYPTSTSPESSDIAFTKLLGTIASGSSTSLTFWQWGAADLTTLTDIKNAVGADASALNPPSTMTQAAYRLFNNTNSTDVGTALAAQNTAVTLGSTGATFRARVLANVSGADLALNKQFKLQYVERGTTGTCASPTGTWTDVSSSTPIAFNDNATPSNGDPLTANANDPTDGSNTIMNQTYVEANPVSNTQSVVLVGQDGKWDFSLKDNNAPGGTTYCLRMVWNSGTLFSSYTNYPQVTTASGGTVSCSTSPTSTSFGTLNLSGVATASPNTTTTLSCTYSGGCTLYINDAGNGTSPGLWASAVSHLIASANSTLSAGTEGYGIQAATSTAGSGATLTLASAYHQTGDTVGGLLRSQTSLASSTASFTGREVITTHKAAIAGTTPAGSYADTITYGCVGN